MKKEEIILICALCLSLGAAKRNVSSPVVNPKCPTEKDYCNDLWVIHVTAEGTSDVMHHLWGTMGAPTFMTVLASPQVKLNIDWDSLFAGKDGSVTFDDSREVTYAFGFAIPNMILFNDVNDTGKINNIPEKDRFYVPMSDYTWSIKESFNKSRHEGGVMFESVYFRGEPLPNDTRIAIQIVAHGDEGRNGVLPHLITTPDSAQFDIILDHLVLNLNGSTELKADITPISGFTNPRWAMELVIFSFEDKEEVELGYMYATHKSLNDENTPGVFNIDEITTNLSRKAQKGGYLQWRPVSYLSSERDINHSTFPNMNDTFTPLEKLDEPLNRSLAYAVFGSSLVDRMVSTKTVVSYGEPKDNFYTDANYTTWTLAFGVGSPPEEKFSTLIVVVLSLGVGIPSLVFLLGGSFIGYRKCRSN